MGYTCFNPFPHIDAFWRLRSRRLLKSKWQMEKLLILNNFSISHNDFISIQLQSCLLKIDCMWVRVNISVADAFKEWWNGGNAQNEQIPIMSSFDSSINMTYMYMFVLILQSLISKQNNDPSIFKSGNRFAINLNTYATENHWKTLRKY